MLVQQGRPLVRDASGHAVDEDEDDEVMAALHSTPRLVELGGDAHRKRSVKQLLRKASEQETGDARYDAMTAMRLLVMWQTHLKGCAQEAAAQQTALEERLLRCDEHANATLYAMQGHTMLVTEFVEQLPELRELAKAAETTALRVAYATDAAHRLDAALRAVECRTEQLQAKQRR